MEIWLIQKGKKTGPFQDYEVRNRITDGQLDADQYAWHEGLPSWVKLGEIELFRSDLEKLQGQASVPPEFEVPPSSVEQSPVVLTHEKRHLARRFWARWLDLMLYATVWWLLIYLVGRDIGAAMRSDLMKILIFIPWFAIEAWLLHRFGTTPGKWLMGIRVVNEDESELTLKASIWRSIRVLIVGIGFGWGFLSLLCQTMSWFTTRKIGKPVWDYMGKHKIVVTPLGAFRIITLVVLMFIASQLQTAVKGPYMQEEILKQYPEMKEFFEKGNPMYFPVKQ